MSNYSYYPSGGHLSTDGVATQAAAQPAAPAIITEGRTSSWADLDASIDERARALVGLGISKGDRVAVALETSALAGEMLFATMRLGATLALLPLDAPGVHIEMMTEQLGSVPTFTQEDIESATPAAWYQPVEADDGDPALIAFTSGTEGAPRGVVLSHGNLRASARASTRAMRLLPGDRWLACLPFHHIAGPSIFLRAAEAGFAVSPLPLFEPGLVIDTIADAGITAISLVPTMLARLLQAGWTGAPSLRLVLLGGGPCSLPLLNSAIDKRIPVAPTYGLTEASSHVTVLLPTETRGHFGSSGRPLPGIQVRIGGRPDQPAASREPGRLWIKGPTVSAEALDGPLLEDGWLPTSDMGRMDADGYVTVVGRIDDVIITGGEKVIPADVEMALTADPLVGEVAVIGVPDSEWGQRVVAILTPRENCPEPDPIALRDMLKQKLVPHKVPKRIVIVAQLPRTAMGKLDRDALRELGRADD